MKKKIFAMMLAILMVLSLASCTVEHSNAISNFGGLMKVPGRDLLFYDQNTKVVYYAYSEASGYRGYGFMSAYYAPNGLPYLYDVDTQTLVEIQPD